MVLTNAAEYEWNEEPRSKRKHENEMSSCSNAKDHDKYQTGHFWRIVRVEIERRQASFCQCVMIHDVSAVTSKEAGMLD